MGTETPESNNEHDFKTLNPQPETPNKKLTSDVAEVGAEQSLELCASVLEDTIGPEEVLFERETGL